MATSSPSHSVRDAVEPVLGLLESYMVVAALRWASVQDDEREAIAAFNEEDFQPSVPEALRWKILKSTPMIGTAAIPEWERWA